jgi:hypothetical protein
LPQIQRPTVHDQIVPMIDEGLLTARPHSCPLSTYTFCIANCQSIHMCTACYIKEDEVHLDSLVVSGSSNPSFEDIRIAPIPYSSVLEDDDVSSLVSGSTNYLNLKICTRIT